MSEKTRKTLVYLSLPIAMAWGAWNFMGKPGQDPSAYLSPTIQPLEGSADAVQNADRSSAEITEETPWGRDPFARSAKPATLTSEAPTYWKLSGIVYSKTAPMAIINNKPVQVGDEIDGAHVTKIGKNDVTITFNGSSVTLYVEHG